MAYKAGSGYSPIDPNSGPNFDWLEGPVNFIEDACHDGRRKAGQIGGFFRSIREVWDEPDWRKRAARHRR